MISRRGVASVGIVALVVAASAVRAADNQKAFEKRWDGRRVVLKRTLYSLVYNERGLVGTIHAGRRAGLTVVTPFAGTYFQFDGRHHVDDVVEHDVQKIIKSVSLAYRKGRPLDEGWVQEIEPVRLVRYEDGVELKVRAIHVKGDAVRLELVSASGDDEEATSLVVKWPTPWSKSFSERGTVEGLIQQFLILPE